MEWVGEWVGEKKAVGMRCWSLWVEWVIEKVEEEQAV